MNKIKIAIGFVAVLVLAGISLGAYRSVTYEMTPISASTIAAGVGGMYTSNADTKPHFVTSAGVDYAAGDAWHLHTTAGAPGSLVLGDCWTDSTDSYRVWCKESSGNIRQRFVGTAPGPLGCGGTPSTGCFTSVTIGGAPAEAVFSRTCTITSAAAATPVVCLADADVPAGKKAYLLGWHAKVNGATAWATTTVCRIADTSGAGGSGVLFISALVAALTSNAFIADNSANITQESAYSLNTSGTADYGLQVACDLNGTGSDLVVTLYGAIK